MVTGALNFVLNTKLTADKNGGEVINTSVETFFSSYRAEREVARAEEFSCLDAVKASQDSTPDMITAANEKRNELLGIIEKEMVLEGLIKAKGFEDAFVTMNTNNVNVVVSNTELANEQIAQIIDIILDQTDYRSKQVFIVPCMAE